MKTDVKSAEPEIMLRGTDTAVGATPAPMPDAIEAELERTRQRAERLAEPGPFRSGLDVMRSPGNKTVKPRG